MQNDLTITQGDEKAYNLSFDNGEGAVDITGATVKMTVKRTLNDEPIIEKVVTEHTDAENGKSLITLTADDTDVPLGKYYYDIQISGGELPKKTISKGKLEITWQVTED